MSLKRRKSVILLAVEAVYGVLEVLDGGDAFLTSNLRLTPLEGNTVSRNLDRPTFGASEEEHSSAYVMVEFDVEYQGSGTAGDAPAYGPAMQVCQRDEAITAATKVDYVHNSENGDSASIACYYDGQLHTLVGARGEVTLRINSQQLPYLHFRMVGLWVDPASAAAPSPTGWANFIKPHPVNNAFTSQLTLWGQPLVLKSLEYTQGNDVQHFDNPGEEQVEIIDRRGSGRISALAVALSVKNFFKDAKENTTGALAITHGLASGNICQFTAPNVSLVKPTYGDDQGRLTIDAQLVFTPTATGDDESVISVSRATA